MKLCELIDTARLKELVEQKYVSARNHPTLPLTILNYTPSATEIRQWDDTLSYCRGLVYDFETDEVVATPFKKFWNYGDENHTGPLPNRTPRIFEKVDGSYLNLFFYKEEVVVSTRGSFESDQAKWAQKWVLEHFISENTNENTFVYNYIFEVVIYEDKKVVDYDFSGLVFLGRTRLDDAAEFDNDVSLPWLTDYRVAKELQYEDLEKLQARNINNEEGYVAVWYGGTQRPTFRVKLKFETYKLLHRMYFQTTTEVIWELTKAGENIAKHLEGADPRLLNWAMAVSLSVLENYHDLKLDSSQEFRDAIQMTNILWNLESPEKERRKTFAMYATKSKNPNLLFTLYDGKMVQYEECLWKLVKPENSRFRNETEEES